MLTKFGIFWSDCLEAAYLGFFEAENIDEIAGYVKVISDEKYIEKTVRKMNLWVSDIEGMIGDEREFPGIYSNDAYFDENFLNRQDTITLDSDDLAENLVVVFAEIYRNLEIENPPTIEMIRATIAGKEFVSESSIEDGTPVFFVDPEETFFFVNRNSYRINKNGTSKRVKSFASDGNFNDKNYVPVSAVEANTLEGDDLIEIMTVPNFARNAGTLWGKVKEYPHIEITGFHEHDIRYLAKIIVSANEFHTK